MTVGHRILLIAHGHPDFTLGGGELAAYNLFRALRERPDVAATCFLARVDGIPNGFIRPRRRDEYLWQQAMQNQFLYQAGLPLVSLENFRRLLEQFQPSVVFIHHFVHIGIEILRVIRQCTWPIRIVLTLHEMLAICHHHGQMVKTRSLRLCREATPDDCHGCFPERSREDFWLRKRYLQRHFDAVDHFVTPSEFLKGRYVEWGVAPERISVIENGQPVRKPLAPRPLREGELRGRFGFFGQVTPYKGLDVLLQAMALVPKTMEGKLFLEVHGANLDLQNEDFRNRLGPLIARLQESGMLRLAGPYDRGQLASRVGGVDWMVVPSIWWENSPLVIQEAFSLGRPVICSGIGGMAEKVRDGVDGLHVEPGNASAWAATLASAAERPMLWGQLADNIKPPMTLTEAAEHYVSLASGPESPHLALQSTQRKRPEVDQALA